MIYSKRNGRIWLLALSSVEDVKDSELVGYKLYLEEMNK